MTHGVGEDCWHAPPSLVLWLGHLLPPPACHVESRSGPHGTEPRHVLSPATLQICRLLASPSPFRGLTPALLLGARSTDLPLHLSVSANCSLPETLWPRGSPSHNTERLFVRKGQIHSETYSCILCNLPLCSFQQTAAQRRARVIIPGFGAGRGMAWRVPDRPYCDLLSRDVRIFPTPVSILTRHPSYYDGYQNITSVATVILLKKMCWKLGSVLFLCCKMNTSVGGCRLAVGRTIGRTKDILGVTFSWRAWAKGSRAFGRQLRELEIYLGTGTTSKLGVHSPCEFPPKEEQSGPWFSKWVPWRSASPGKVIKMQILRSHSRLAPSDTAEPGIKIQVLTLSGLSPPGDADTQPSLGILALQFYSKMIHQCKESVERSETSVKAVINSVIDFQGGTVCRGLAGDSQRYVHLPETA